MACIDILRSLDVGNATEMANISPQGKLQKIFRPTFTWLETKKLQNAIAENRAILEEERTEKFTQLSQAEWLPESHLAKVTKQVGRHWMTMGHSYLGDMFLHPEEALFLLEANTMEIQFGGVPMSLQQAYSLLLADGTGCTLEEYRAFSHLSRYGYKVRRHKPELSGNLKREVDVVGVICKRKSVDEVAPEVSGANLPNTRLSSTSKAHCEDDDDIKFIEFVESHKKRKVTSSITINDDAQIASNDSTGKESCGSCISVIGGQLDGTEYENAKHETANQSCNTFNLNSELQSFDSSIPANRPSRGMYRNNPLVTASTDVELLTEDLSPGNTSLAQSNSKNEENSYSIDKKRCVPGVLNDDIIVLSDDETNEDNKQTKELLKFYKEISLIELIDISEEDEGRKDQVSQINCSNDMEDNAIDFWGVLGRVPTLENGRMTLRIPAPPLGLIPANIKLFKKEYAIDMMTSLERSRKEERHCGVAESYKRKGMPGGAKESKGQRRRRTIQEWHRQGKTELQGRNRLVAGNEHPSQQISWGYIPHASCHSYGINHRNSWSNYAHQPSTIGSNPGHESNHSNQFSGCFSRPLWNSVVYTERHYPPTAQCHPYNSPSVPYLYQNIQQMSYPFPRYGYANQQYRVGNMPNQWQNHSGYSNFQRNIGSWARGGSGHYARDTLKQRRAVSSNVSHNHEESYSCAVPKIPDALNWLDLKAKSDLRKPSGVHVDAKGECTKECSTDILPLVKPSDCTTIDVVQSQLQITSSSKDNYCNSSENYSSSLSIKFDLYAPNSNFRKSYPGLPKYRISIVKSEDKIPRLKDIQCLLKDLIDEVPLLFVVCSTENINFFSLSDVGLPQPKSM